MTSTTGRESDKFMLRLPEGMRDDIKFAANESGRSMNAEIVHRLANSFRSNTPMGEAGYKFFDDSSDGLKMNEDLNHQLANEAAAKGITIREEIESRLFLSFNSSPGFAAQLSEHLSEAFRRLSAAEAALDDAQRYINQLSPAEKIILRERDYISSVVPKKRADFRVMLDHIELRPIGGCGRIVLKAPSFLDDFPQDNDREDR
ncbi:Arc family DNA-binding protein [Neorhizobium sp. T786]|uniref:Arc family DNA-binding protein n=1 Tax=Pseudorhizobium xiangyangii TaxID=2883104 RepID=UPI001D000DC2|nr:Arc family DNA-binding protein [Neorhizobium xiangyangii]MCB5201812.1 Arc family DNA-binding protein [Neorhizobium xiangyangii]